MIGRMVRIRSDVNSVTSNLKIDNIHSGKLLRREQLKSGEEVFNKEGLLGIQRPISTPGYHLNGGSFLKVSH